jgi:hypothetical protein
LITQRLLADVEEHVEVEPVGEFMLKGFQRPVTAFNLIAVREPMALAAADERSRGSASDSAQWRGSSGT